MGPNQALQLTHKQTSQAPNETKSSPGNSNGSKLNSLWAGRKSFQIRVKSDLGSPNWPQSKPWRPKWFQIEPSKTWRPQIDPDRAFGRPGWLQGKPWRSQMVPNRFSWFQLQSKPWAPQMTPNRTLEGPVGFKPCPGGPKWLQIEAWKPNWLQCKRPQLAPNRSRPEASIGTHMVLPRCLSPQPQWQLRAHASRKTCFFHLPAGPPKHTHQNNTTWTILGGLGPKSSKIIPKQYQAIGAAWARNRSKLYKNDTIWIMWAAWARNRPTWHQNDTICVIWTIGAAWARNRQK